MKTFVRLLAAGLALGSLVSCGGVGGGFTGGTTNPAPSLSTITPNSAMAGSQGFALTVNGSGFVSTSVVRWNGSNRATSFVNSTQLTASVPATDIAVDGTAQITVFNPSPGGGTSNALAFTITPGVLTITTASLPAATGGKVYDFTLASLSGVSPLNWSLAAGSLPLPPSLSIDAASGRISGAVDPVGGDTRFDFTAQVTDSATPQPQAATKDLSILVRATPPGPNNACPAEATPIGNGTIRASLSPYADIDVYSFQGTQGAQVTIETFAQRLELDGDPLTRDSFADTVVELLDTSCNGLTFIDDIDPGIIQDSLLTFSLPSSGTFFIRVRDFRGDGRADLIYELRLSGAN